MRTAPLSAVLMIIGLMLSRAFAADAGDSLKLNQIQTVGTAESYKLAPGDAMLRLIRMGGKKDALKLDFGEPPLAAQLDDGAASLSFDIAYDPNGGLFKNPAGASMASELLDKDFTDAMSQPGFKVIHVLDVDYKSSCLTLKTCLAQVASWSRAHPRHLPLVISLTSNDCKTPMPGATKPLPFDAAAMLALEDEIRATFRPREIITPAKVKARHASLREAVMSGGWPSLKTARGKILFVLNDEPAKTALYHGGLMFVTADENAPDAGFVAIADPIKDRERIGAAVKAGFIVITRADAETQEARASDTKRRDAAFASGAQIIQTDFLVADKNIGPYQAGLEDRRHFQCDVLTAACPRRDSAMTQTATAR